MAVENFQSAQIAAQVNAGRMRPTEDHGKLRVQYFRAVAGVAGDANSTIDLCELPPGAVRVLPGLSRISCSALGAGRQLDVGHRAYQKRYNEDEPQNFEAFIANLDVSSAVNGGAFGTGIKYDVYSLTGVTVAAQVTGGTIPQNSVVEGYITYAYE